MGENEKFCCVEGELWSVLLCFKNQNKK